MTALMAFAAGLVFGIGLLVSGMANPAKVLGFLDVAGRWDPSLIVVMLTAIPIAAFAYRRKSTLFGAPLELPSVRNIDRRLVAGAIVFGAGWGLAGFCPAPAIVAVGAGRVQALVFIVALLVGMAMFELIERTRAQRAATAREDA
jgi:uncharacterized protein